MFLRPEVHCRGQARGSRSTRAFLAHRNHDHLLPVLQLRLETLSPLAGNPDLRRLGGVLYRCSRRRRLLLLAVALREVPLADCERDHVLIVGDADLEKPPTAKQVEDIDKIPSPVPLERPLQAPYAHAIDGDVGVIHVANGVDQSQASDEDADERDDDGSRDDWLHHEPAAGGEDAIQRGRDHADRLVDLAEKVHSGEDQARPEEEEEKSKED
mmetsp:Transcript_46111/g.100149  ORF Transcript_46111/g.100149 Transcript_46111/m.100149 type:complete len:213 (+) Transcript_46111:1051-1689(+)